MKYIIFNKRIYGLDANAYQQLRVLEIHYRHAKKKADEAEDMMMAYDEYNDLNNFLRWVEENVKPTSGERDNFDLHRYDERCYREHVGDDKDLPF